MKFLIVLIALFAVALAAPHEHEDADIVKLHSQPDNKHYNWDLETSNGIHQHEEGEVKDYEKDHAICGVRRIMALQRHLVVTCLTPATPTGYGWPSSGRGRQPADTNLSLWLPPYVLLVPAGRPTS
ncbi:uncharacterized protein LOC106093584 [Stomoxys calcitrans]|uniref:uncharacterized protein LOC106093584 n=1 Tax=Stomoxys calcitrans TaxID=35570 RepID=UPI0027E3AD42|nr:uncharacterized protein LOC106093584 [Stomoxys calcitrans]